MHDAEIVQLGDLRHGLASDVVAEKGALGASLDDVGARAAASRSQLYRALDGALVLIGTYRATSLDAETSSTR
jgi:hypothetical protein